jgi:hypothetical protein
LKKSIKSKSFKIKSNPNQIQVLKKFLSGEWELSDKTKCKRMK